ncbi:MAG: 6-bladed beta-propeller, partial [Chloroflexota bacterium]
IVVQLNYQRKLYYFSFDGEFLKEIDFDRNVSYIKVCQDGRYILQERGAGGYEKYSFCLTTDTWDTLSHVENYTKWENKSNMVISIGYPSFESFYEADGKMHMKDMYNDTVYYVDDTQLKPAYFLNMGEFRLPGDLRPEKLGPDMISQFNENSGKYFFGTLHEAAGKIFLAAHCYRDAPSRYVVFDKATGTATYLSDGNEPAKGFIDDMNGITEIWPIGSANENQVFMPVSVMSLQKQIKENAARTAKFPEKQKELEQMIMSMDPTDNPLLVLVTLK